MTGQITVSASAMLNADGTATGERPNPYNVIVRAVDGDGKTQDIDVTIGVLQANEPPRIDRVYVTPDRVPTATGTSPVTISAGDRAPTEMSHYELDRDQRCYCHRDRHKPGHRCSHNGRACYLLRNGPGWRHPWLGRWKGPTVEAFDIDTKTDGLPTNATLAFAGGPDFEE